ncbi:permease prefix domain 1-containing protein [Peribacillus sp. SCS-26]|uniref:permease prefix domain 1-containing protein n=1 Tax=Paraperibacillus marinus TaxID=3115295 RepID=UPI003906626B
MKQIDRYVNSIYKDVAGNKQEIEDLRQEMRSHLIESVEEQQAKGKSKEEAIRIAIENFGSESQIKKGLSEFFKVQKKFTNYVLTFSIIFLLSGIFFLAAGFLEVKNIADVEQERSDIMTEIFDAMGSSNKVTGREKEQLLTIFKKHEDKLNVAAVFKADGLENWLRENEEVKGEPNTHFPIDYTKAEIVIKNNDIVGNKAQIVPGSYDLGTVIMADEQWIVQFEYKPSYEATIEKYHQLKHYTGPSTWTFYQLPILFFSLFIVLGIIWLFLKRQNRQLKGVIK